MKIISLIAIGLACILTGKYVAFRLDKRVHTLENMILMFSTIENEISYLSRPTVELIELLTQKDDLRELDFLAECALLVRNGTDINEAWTTSLSHSKKFIGEDACILYSFGENLGRSNIDGQLSNCRYHINSAQERLNEAREKKSRYASLACGLGVLSGIGIFIILF